MYCEGEWRWLPGQRAVRDAVLPGRSVRQAQLSSVLDAADPERQRWNQQSVSSGELARVYGFTDVDGTSPDIWKHMEESEQ
jgi:hypothetical protein